MLGGGVMTGGGHGAVAAAMRAELGGYVAAPALADSGLVGAFLLARALATG